MKNIILKYGFIGGSTLVLFSGINWFCLSNQLDYSNSELFGYLTILIALSTIPLSIRYYQIQHIEQTISTKEILSLGLGISSIVAICMYVYSVLFFSYLGDDFMKWSQENMDAAQWQQMEAQLSTMPSYFLNPWFQAFVMFMTVFLIGFIITMLCFLFIKTFKN